MPNQPSPPTTDRQKEAFLRKLEEIVVKKNQEKKPAPKGGKPA